MEERAEYRVLNQSQNHDKLTSSQRPLTTHDLAELERELRELERKLIPLLNAVRAIQGKKPICVTKE